MSDEQLRSALRQWRYQKAQSQGNKPYIIFADRTLDDLIAKRPTTAMGLLEVTGLGGVKVNRYGKEILDILSQFQPVQQAIDTPSTPPQNPAVTYTIPSIAKQRVDTAWTGKDVTTLTDLYAAHKSPKVMAIILGRTENAINLKLSSMGLSPGARFVPVYKQDDSPPGSGGPSGFSQKRGYDDNNDEKEAEPAPAKKVKIEAPEPVVPAGPPALPALATATEQQLREFLDAFDQPYEQYGNRECLRQTVEQYLPLWHMKHMLWCDKHVPQPERWWKILQLPVGSSQKEIRRVVRELNLLIHPDKNKIPGANSAFSILNQAKEALLK